MTAQPMTAQPLYEIWGGDLSQQSYFDNAVTFLESAKSLDEAVKLAASYHKQNYAAYVINHETREPVDVSRALAELNAPSPAVLTMYDRFAEKIDKEYGLLSIGSRAVLKDMLSKMAEDAFARGVAEGKSGQAQVLPLVDEKGAVALGFAEFNPGPHLCVEVPDGHYTISTRTSEGKLTTFSFVEGKRSGPAICVDIMYHNSGLPTVKNGGEDLATFNSIGFTVGSNTFDTRKITQPTTLITVLLDQ